MLKSKHCYLFFSIVIFSSFARASNDKLAAQLMEVGYNRLFQSGEPGLADSIWHSGKNQQVLLEIVTGMGYDNYARLLASEILFEKKMNYPAKELEDTLAYIYSKALFITGHSARHDFAGDLWAYMSQRDQYDGELGLRLVQIGKKTVPYLSKLLDDTVLIFSLGGDGLESEIITYRVKDIAAYYIGKITGIAVPLRENLTGRDADADIEIERLKKKLGINLNNGELAAQLMEARYAGLFQYGEQSLADSIWQNGRNEKALKDIILRKENGDYVRLLASEVLYAKNPDYPPSGWADIMAYIYSQALVMSGQNGKVLIAGNRWGFMYYGDNNNINHYDEFGSHLMGTGKKAIPYLSKMLTDTNMLFYEGSKEATIGNGLKYRVKDAAAYYIGKITGDTVPFHENFIDRDNEIEMLSKKIK